MSSTDRQNRLLLAEDWKKIYQSYRNADFQSYDFENLRRVMIDYIRQNYPEDFNDYIESSEYLALIDLVAFLGQSIAFRVDLNARENFLELAERRDSILRLARLISYNAKRNIPAQGLLKFNTIQTTENVIDSNGRNLSGQIITWNDPSNSNWYDQFFKVINAAFSPNQQFGNPSDRATIQGTPTEQYRFESSNADVPVYSFTKSISGSTMNFEITSTTFNGQNYIYEESPKISNKIACVYKDDGRGYGSAGTGFYFNFTQGSLNTGTFTITQPSSNESIDIDSQNINNNDIWLYRLDANGSESELWTQVPSFEGNNIIYNSIIKSIRNIYGVTTRVGDSVSLTFSDGTFGNLPLGTFRTYYRISNGLSYTINTQDIKNVSIAIPYTSVTGQIETLSLSLSLATSVSNSDASETNTSIKSNAPANYYTQNRMITGEDYNISPLSVNQQVLKVKSVNRTSSGISRYFDLVDPTGKYSTTNLFADDGVLYTEAYTSSTRFSYATRTDIEGIIYNTVLDIISNNGIRNFYYSNYINYVTTSMNILWNSVTTDYNSSTGNIGNILDGEIYAVGSTVNTLLKYITPGALVKFSAPTGQYFDTTNNNKLTNGVATPLGAKTEIWAEVVSIIDDGRANGTGVLSDGTGPITMNRVIPTNAIITQIIPKWRTSLDSAVVTTMIDLIFANKPFGLRYDASTQAWKVIFETNLDTSSNFSLLKQGIVTNTQQDSSWILLFTTDNEYYTITSRESRYIFESDKQLRFYFDSNLKIYDSRTNSIINDRINVLGVNNQPDSTQPFTTDIKWDIVSEYVGLDGYVDTKKIIVTFSDTDFNGAVDNPESFLNIVAPSNNILTKYIVLEKYTISIGQEDYRYVSNSDTKVKILQSQTDVGSLIQYQSGQYFYFIDTDVVKQLKLPAGTFTPTLDYKVYSGRDNLKFQYTHSADYDSRIDPGVSNIMDVYILTKSYDILYRQWLNGASVDMPLPPSSVELYNTLSTNLNLIKATSDEIVYHPVNYRILFGSKATPDLQASFKVIKTQGQVISNNDIKSQVISAINEFFALENWDFGDTFYFSELSTYVMNKLSPNISTIVIVPRQGTLNFGSLFEIKSLSNQLFINGATVDDIEIITGITTSNIKSVSGTAVDSTVSSQQSITSSSYGSN
jgi:hypothetical protein